MSNKVEGREIFSVGKWNNIEFSEDDLDDIVANFEKLKDRHKVPLKFGHNKEQPLTDGQPAIGWVSKIYKKGGKILADFSDVPSIVVEAIKKKLYRFVSIELLFNVKADGTKFNHVLDAVSLLGADIPAVNNLADLNALLATRIGFAEGHRIAFSTVAGNVKNREEFELDKEIKDAVDAAVAQAIKPLADANVQLTKDLDEANKKIAKFQSDAADAERKNQEEKVKMARKAITDHLDSAVRAKTLTPAIREVYEKQIGLADDARVLDIDLEQVKLMYSAEKPKGNDATGFHQESDDDGDTENAEGKLLTLVREHQEKHNVSFSKALETVARANPKLHVAYLDANGEVRS